MVVTIRAFVSAGAAGTTITNQAQIAFVAGQPRVLEIPTLDLGALALLAVLLAAAALVFLRR